MLRKLNTLANGRMIFKMDRVRKRGQRDQNLLVNISMAKNLVMVSITGKKGHNIRVNG